MVEGAFGTVYSEAPELNSPAQYYGPAYITPTDEVTGLPACFAPMETLPPVMRPGERNVERFADLNHMFPKAEVRAGLGSEFDEVAVLALINLRGQWVEWGQHHDVYNHVYIGPRLPTTDAQLASTLLYGLAGDIPEIAIDLTGYSPKEVGLTMQERKMLWESGQVRTISEGEVRRYLFRYVMEQSVDHIRVKDLADFLREPDRERRIYRAHCLAAKIVERAVEPFEEGYQYVRAYGVNGERLPAHPRDFLKPRLVPRGSTGRLVATLVQRLGSYRREQGIDLPPLIAA